MKKWMLGFAAVTVLFSGLWSFAWWGPPKLRLVEKHGMSLEFAKTLHHLIESHSGRLPNDWEEFEQWQSQGYGVVRWSAEGTARRMKILDPPFKVIDGIPQIIRVIDPDLKAMEDYINIRVDYARSKT